MVWGKKGGGRLVYVLRGERGAVDSDGLLLPRPLRLTRTRMVYLVARITSYGISCIVILTRITSYVIPCTVILTRITSYGIPCNS